MVLKQSIIYFSNGEISLGGVRVLSVHWFIFPLFTFLAVLQFPRSIEAGSTVGRKRLLRAESRMWVGNPNVVPMKNNAASSGLHLHAALQRPVQSEVQSII